MDSKIAIMLAAFFAFVIALVWASGAHAAGFPFEQRDCGTIGNVLAVAGHVRDQGTPEDEFKKQAADALEGCRAEHGRDGCSIRNQAQQDFVNSAFDYLWQHPKADAGEFATEFFTMCTAVAGKPI